MISSPLSPSAVAVAITGAGGTQRERVPSGSPGRAHRHGGRDPSRSTDELAGGTMHTNACLAGLEGVNVAGVGTMYPMYSTILIIFGFMVSK